MAIQRISEAVVQGGQVVLNNLPMKDGERVQVIVTQLEEGKKRSITEIRKILGGSVNRYDQPFELMIPEKDWEMLKGSPL
jgi:predicted DNA-binding antitoxin AbrB/MazE fold protein